ncbi:MAG: hypothetical protein HFF44_04110 [Lawsonibacter sp.]|nr:hypothetical protein [Lawsonibacter sp.]
MNNEEKILVILEKHGEILEKQGEILEKHGEILEKHGEMLEKLNQTVEKHGEMLEKLNQTVEKQGEMLEKLNQTVERQGEILEKQGEMLERHETALEKLQLDVSGIKVRLDVEVKTQFNLLAEGQQTILDTMVPKDQTDELEADVVVLKTAVRMLTQDVAELKEAR